MRPVLVRHSVTFVSPLASFPRSNHQAQDTLATWTQPSLRIHSSIFHTHRHPIEAMTVSRVAVLTALCAISSHAFAPTRPQAATMRTRVWAKDSNDEEKTTTVTSVFKKELAFDAKDGRFFETNADECIPDDEFCMVDEETGKPIRLTLEEKERIFLDSLQVSSCRRNLQCAILPLLVLLHVRSPNAQ